jgi:hypothetical protein
MEKQMSLKTKCMKTILYDLEKDLEQEYLYLINDIKILLYCYYSTRWQRYEIALLAKVIELYEEISMEDEFLANILKDFYYIETFTFDAERTEFSGSDQEYRLTVEDFRSKLLEDQFVLDVKYNGNSFECVRICNKLHHIFDVGERQLKSLEYEEYDSDDEFDYELDHGERYIIPRKLDWSEYSEEQKNEAEENPFSDLYLLGVKEICEYVNIKGRASKVFLEWFYE